MSNPDIEKLYSCATQNNRLKDREEYRRANVNATSEELAVVATLNFWDAKTLFGRLLLLHTFFEKEANYLIHTIAGNTSPTKDENARRALIASFDIVGRAIGKAPSQDINPLARLNIRPLNPREATL